MATVSLPLRMTTHPLRPYPHDAAPVQIPAGPETTIEDVKSALQEQWEGRPSVEGIVLVWGGRVLSDKERLADIVTPSADSSVPPPVIHAIVRPSAWSVPFGEAPVPVTPSPAASTSTAPPPIPTAAPAPAITSAPSATPAAPAPAATNPYPQYLAYLSQLIPLQRSLLLLNLQKAHYFYSQLIQHRLAALGWAQENPLSLSLALLVAKEDAYGLREGESEEQWKERMTTEEVGEVVSLLQGCQLWEGVELAVREAQTQVETWSEREAAEARAQDEFEVVQIGGLPFLLHNPPQYTEPLAAPPLEQFLGLKRAQAITQILTTLLQLLITYQPTAPSIAYGRVLLRNQYAPPVVGAVELPVDLVIAPAVRRRRGTVNIIINLEAILSIFIPLLLLSLKLGFLLWIFGRHASFNKRVILGVMAAAYVAWEGLGLVMRRRGVPAAGRRRAPPLPARREAAAPAAPVADIPPAAADQQLPPGLRQRHAPPPLVPAAGVPVAAVPVVAGRALRTPREPTSRLTPRYWINYVAAIGLASEARELGLIPRSIAGRPITNPPPPLTVRNPNDRMGLARDARARAVRTAMVGVVLFFGTLLPEVEKKRRRALEKRERLLETRRISRARRAAAAVATAVATASGVATPVLAADPDQARRPVGIPADPRVVPPVVQVVDTDAPAPADPPSSTANDAVTSTPQGRQRVTDAALFADGPGEPDQLPLAPSLPSAEGPPAARAPAVVAGGGADHEGEGEDNEVDIIGEEEGEGEQEPEDDELDNVADIF